MRLTFIGGIVTGLVLSLFPLCVLLLVPEAPSLKMLGFFFPHVEHIGSWPPLRAIDWFAAS